MKMKVRDTKAAGYILLIAGLSLIGYTVFSVYAVFTGSDPPLQVLKENSNDMGGANNSSASQPDLSQLIKPLYPLFNLSAWLLVAFFLVTVGGRISMIGIQLMKVNTSEEIDQPNETRKEKRGVDSKSGKHQQK